MCINLWGKRFEKIIDKIPTWCDDQSGASLGFFVEKLFSLKFRRIIYKKSENLSYLDFIVKN